MGTIKPVGLYDIVTKSINKKLYVSKDIFKSKIAQDYFAVFNDYFDIKDPVECENFSEYAKYLLEEKNNFNFDEAKVITNFYSQYLMFRTNEYEKEGFNEIKLVEDNCCEMPFVFFDFENKKTCINKKHLELALSCEDQKIEKENLYYLLIYLTEEIFLNNYDKTVPNFFDFLNNYDREYYLNIKV